MTALGQLAIPELSLRLLLGLTLGFRLRLLLGFEVLPVSRGQRTERLVHFVADPAFLLGFL